MLLGVDVGGTFTDAVLALDGRIVTREGADALRDDQSEGVMAAIAAALEPAGARAGEIERFCHGMTVATNALLEGQGARTALIATEGFTDIVALGRQNRADLYRLCATRPAPLVPDELRFGARERNARRDALTAGGGEARRLASHVADAGVEAVAVVLLHSYRHPEHERAIGEALARRAARTSTSRSRTRSSARSASTSARRRPRSTRPSPRCCAATCARSARARARRASPSRR